jgi:hypothetical protein
MKRVVLCLKQKVRQGHENDFGVLNGYKTIYTIKGGGYKKLCKLAKDYSKKIGNLYIDDKWFCSSDDLEWRLAAVCVETLFTLTKDHGSGVVCDYFEHGEHVNTIVEDAKHYLEEERKRKEFGTLKKILNKLYALQKKGIAHSFEIDFRKYEDGAVSVNVVLFMKADSEPQCFSFYDFEDADKHIREYECLLEVFEGHLERRR